MALSDIEASNDYLSQAIPKDAPEYAEIGPSKVSADKALTSGYANINPTEGLPSDILDPHYHEASCTATRVMYVASDNRPAQQYTSLDEASIQEKGEYSTLK